MTAPTQQAPASPPPGAGGQPAPTQRAPRRRRPLVPILITGAIVVIVGLVAALGFKALGPTGGVEESSASPNRTFSSSVVTDAGTELSHMAEDSRSYLQNEVDGKWVTQLSAKKEGMETSDGKVWDAAAILDEHNALNKEYGETVLIRSSEWSSFQLGGYWVTALKTPYDSADQALAKCKEIGRDRDNCFAKLVSSTDSPTGSTVLNP